MCNASLINFRFLSNLYARRCFSRLFLVAPDLCRVCCPILLRRFYFYLLPRVTSVLSCINSLYSNTWSHDFRAISTSTFYENSGVRAYYYTRKPEGTFVWQSSGELCCWQALCFYLMTESCQFKSFRNYRDARVEWRGS